MGLSPIWSRNKRRPPFWRAVSTAAAELVLCAVLAISLAQKSFAAAEDVLAGAFDKITGVPFAGTMLGIVRSGEQSPQSPAALDSRLHAVEALLRDMDPRLRLVETRLKQLQSEVVKVSNINRLRELQRIRAELAEINTELETKPTDPGSRSILEFRAQQQADLIKNNVDFDIWKWSDITADQAVRTRFLVYPSFELYSISIATWFAAIELNLGDRPQRIITESGAALRDHAMFLEARTNFHDLLDAPVTLPEYLRTAAYCQLEAVDKFSDRAGNCVFAIICIDTMADKSFETERQTLTMLPPTSGTLCTYNPTRALDLKGEAELRDNYGAQLMAALARDLNRMAQNGSLRDPFVGSFPHFITAQIFSVSLDSPLLAPRGAASGTVPAIPKCISAIGRCSYGVKLSAETGWTISTLDPTAKQGRLVTIKHNASGLCIDVKGSEAVAGASAILFPCNSTPSQIWNLRMSTNSQFALASNNSDMCATVESAVPSHQGVQLTRSLLLQQCDGRHLQQFSTSDSTFRGPN